ncbi:hypothetical protein Q7267_03500 [Glaesserella parasuis]|uniref:Lipoprotein n=4 Tax=Glaesserella parasuis TaxID=738 RepID=B8F648_GLAP5|nr:hypothetical protein [Glaesserella parasuis]AGO15415.1 hypothetical protein K756_00675 [Glaesserella parasuis ZJ0906]ACL32800.1 hypothetical protein HAPS_1197 [Glaesserella parasuis SH0165]AIK18289.1 hypothetical protein JL26_11390 [Glaesserella parasuis]AIK90821.1 hypothetical protein JT17_09080 [Glaesserella parasuis]ATW44797.1 hypothetical protein A2U21_01915 [Glaesserella parasuis str. Nagasaki]
MKKSLLAALVLGAATLSLTACDQAKEKVAEVKQTTETKVEETKQLVETKVDGIKDAVSSQTEEATPVIDTK